eukprot:424215-Prymnesium_polylepis.1
MRDFLLFPALDVWLQLLLRFSSLIFVLEVGPRGEAWASITMTGFGELDITTLAGSAYAMPREGHRAQACHAMYT